MISPKERSSLITIGLGVACQAGIARKTTIAASTPAGRRPLPWIRT
jgi:hypothetical protein